MPRLRVALAQIDTTVGDLTGNAAAVRRYSRRAADGGAQLVVFPEMALTGYPVEDLVLRASFVDAARAAVERLAADLAADGLADLPVVVGYLDRCPNPSPRVGRPAGEPQNAAAWLHGGHVVARYAKHHLPNYGVFDEFRYFVPGTTLPVVRLHGLDVATTICEDLWQQGGPIVAAREAGAGLVLCINGSPYERCKEDLRLDLVAERAREAGAPIAYVNMVGGQDELVFDGDSFVVTAAGEVLGRSPQFVEDLLLVDVDVAVAGSERTGAVPAGDASMSVERVALTTAPLTPVSSAPAQVAPRLEAEEEVFRAIVLGTRDYVRKNGFRSVVLGLSGGIDSALVAVVACDALGADAVHAVGMPSRYSSPGSVADAADLAKRTGLHWQVLGIADVVASYEETLAPAGGLIGLAAENLQARVRGVLLMALSNSAGHLVLTTGNKSELATGFSTLYGDSAGGYAPIKDVPKTLVYRLAHWRNAAAARAGEVEPIPEAILLKAPSAELAPGQVDADRLPAYDELDAVLEDYVTRDLGRAALLAAGHDPATVDRVITLVDTAEYKRRQYPPGPKITLKAFGRDRRLPITSRWRELPVRPRSR